MIDVADAIDAEAEPVQRIRKAAGGYNLDGDAVPGSPSTVPIMAAVQPASGRQLMDLPEGLRTEAQFIIWSRSTIEENDRITYAAETWRVVFVWPRPNDGFFRAAMGKMKT